MAAHILIVDPDASAAQVTDAIVRRVTPGATVTVAPDPERGWLSLLRHRPDVLIIDPAPYNPASARLIQLVKEGFPTSCVIVLASAPTAPLRRRMLLLGADAYLEKPVPLPLLAERLGDLIQRGGHHSRPKPMPTGHPA